MSGKMKRLIISLALVAAGSVFCQPLHADVTGRPHDLSLDNRQGHCLNCHDPHQVNLGDGFAHTLKRSNEMEVCYQCHAGRFNDYSCIDPTMPNRTTLFSRYSIITEFGKAHIHFPRYGMDGVINKCSECHNPHGVFDHTSTTRKPKLLAAQYTSVTRGVVTDTDEYCFVCHNNDANPPYRKFSNISVGKQYRFSRTTYKGMTHSTFYRATTLNEPVPDTARTYDDNPYGKGKDISCLTCHRPHGSAYDHILKKADNQDFCLACHNGSKAASLTSFTTSGHGKTGVKRICQECHFPHGTGQENAVNKTIKDPHTNTDRTTFVNNSGMNTACFACHLSASSNNYFPGKAAYNSGVHRTITSIRNHNPADSAGDQKPGDCDNCHNPHGKGYGKMLVTTQDQNLCYVCHNATTHNTVSGEDVNAAFTQMSSRHDLTKVKCVNCHNVHKTSKTVVMMNPFKPQSTITDYETFCLKCHNGTMPSGVTGAPNIGKEWVGYGHDGPQAMPCSDCHESHGSFNKKNLNYETRTYGGKNANFTRGMYFGSNALCEVCHNRTGLGYRNAFMIPTGPLYVGWHKQGNSKPCSDCHKKKHNPRLSSYTGNSTYYTNACLSQYCHTQTPAGNPYPNSDQDFNTPTNSGDLPLYSSIHKITYNPPTTSDCTKCHGSNHEVDHRATYKVKDPDTANGYTNMSSIRRSNIFCLECHDKTPVSMAGITPSNVSSIWTNGGHDSTHVMFCTDCHEYHKSMNKNLLNYRTKVHGTYSAKFRPGLKFTSRAYCELCHNRNGAGYLNAKMIPTGSQYVQQHYQNETKLCSDCHTQKHNPRLSSYTGNSAYYNNACLSQYCHTANSGNPYPYPDADFNTPTNGSDPNTKRSIHDITYSPPAAVDCVKCHGSNHEVDHRTTNKIKDPDPTHGVTNMSSIRTTSVFCLECHDASPRKLGTYSSPTNILDAYTSLGHGDATAGRMVCYACHEYHGSVNEKLIKAAINGKSVMPIYSGNNVTVCTACHKSYDSRTPQWSGYTVYSGSVHAFGNTTTGNLLTDGRHGPGVCVNCHNPHGAKVDGVKTSSMLNKKQEELCYTCHASGFDNFSTPGDYNNKWNRFGKTKMALKKESKALHYGRNVFGKNTTIWDGLASSNSFKDKDAAVSVKLKMKELTRSDGYESVGLRIEDARDSSKYINVYYRAQSGAAWVSRYSGDSGPVSTALFGDEGTGSAIYHTLKLVRKKATNEFEVWVDGSGIRDNGVHNPNAVVALPSGYFKVMLFCSISGNTDATSETMEAWFDDFKVGYTSDGSAHNTASGDDVQDRFYMKTHHAVSDADQLGKDGVKGTSDDPKIECEDCHDPHTITEKLMAFKNTSDANGRHVVPEAADQAFCIKCHSSSPPAGVKYPAEGVWNKTDYLNSAHGNQLKRDKSFSNYSNGVTYPCKVCHNPHGSNQAAMQRDTWDINRDGIPDDIDGDGVLDSTNMVGFIGYSTGSRKVVLVSAPRAGFQRISSTIPLQSNGTVDIELCLNCHDGSPAPDVEVFFKKRSHHAVTYSDQSTAGWAKIECYTCHDQHRAQARNDARHEYATTNPYSPREPMPGDAPFCLKCHDNTLPPGVSFGNKTGTHRLKNIKLSYNPYNKVDANGYDMLTSYKGHFVQATGEPLMCRDCHNQHGSDYTKMLRDNTEPSKPNYDATQPIQNMQPVILRQDNPLSGGDSLPVTSTPEHCLACHSGATTYKGYLIPLPPPPDAAERGFTMSSVGKHFYLNSSVTAADESGGHIYKNTFAVVTAPGRGTPEACTACHDSHNPYIATVDEQLVDCYQCHNENTSLPDVQSEFNDNPTNPARSKSIHQIKYDPSGATPAYVECLKCHDQTKHMQRRVRLRKDPKQFVNYTSDSEVWVSQLTTNGKVDSTLAFANNSTMDRFCLECHGSVFDGVTSTASSFWRGGTEHVPPKLPTGHARNAHSQNGNYRCTNCHDYHGSKNNLGLKKSDLPGDEEAFCYNCHNNPAKSQNGVNIQAKFNGTASHHKVSGADQADGSKVECTDCHNPHAVTRDKPVVPVFNKATTTAVNDDFCIACHDSNGGPGVKFPGYSTGASAPEWNTSTGKWNKWNKAAYAGRSSIHKQNGLTCKKCHDSHGSGNYALLLTNVSTATNVSVSFGMHSTARGKRKEEVGVTRFCSACHKNSMGVYNGYAGYTGSTFGHKKGIDKNCTYCHNPHGTTQPNLIRSNKPLYMSMTSVRFGSVYNFRTVRGFTNQTTGSPYYSFCSSRNCHKSTNEGSTFDTFNMNYATESGGLTVDNYSHDETVVSHHPIREGTITCTSCHKEHGTSGTNDAPDLRAPYYRQSNWPLTYHTSGIGQYPAATYVHGCYGCGVPQASSFNGSNYWDYYTNGSPNNHRNAIITPSTPSWANDLCFMCHQKEDIIGDPKTGMANANTNFKGHEAVAGGATMSVDISYKLNKSGTDYHNFSCSECHYAHASRKGKLLRRSCFSQYKGDSEFPYTYPTSYGPKNQGGTVDIYNCHSYKNKTGTYWGTNGWRDVLMSPSKSDFKRPPNPVKDLSITFTNQTTLSVGLRWTAVDDAPGVKADHYNVYRSTQPLSQATKPYATRVIRGTNGDNGQYTSWVLTATDNTCQANVTYYYAAVACDAENNESFIYNSVSTQLHADIQKPGTIGNQTLYQNPVGAKAVRITWRDPGDNVNVTKYNIYRKDGATSPITNDQIPGCTLVTFKNDTTLSADGSGDSNTYSYSDAPPTVETSYAYAVVGLDSANNMADVPTGTDRVIYVIDPTPAFVNITTVRPVSGQMSATVTWTAPANDGAIRGYHVYRKEGAQPTQPDMGFRIFSSVNATSVTDSTVPSTDLYYYYTAIAIDASSGKQSALGNTNKYAKLQLPPSNLTASKSANSVIQLNWTAPTNTTNLTSYKVYRRRNGAAWGSALYTVTQPTTTKTDNLANLEPGTYDYAVAAYYSNYMGTTNYETVKSAIATLSITDTKTPSSFTIGKAELTTASGYNRARIEWTAPSDNNYTGYGATGVDWYKVEASYDNGTTWNTRLRTDLTNASFETYSGIADDSTPDKFTGWTKTNTNSYLVTDSLFEGKAVKIKINGTEDVPSIYAIDPNTIPSVGGQTYSMSFWAKANKTTTFQYYIQANHDNWEQIGYQDVSIGTQWQRFTTSGTFSAGTNTTTARAVIRPSTDSTAEITIDGVRMQLGSGATLRDDGSSYQPSGYNVPGTLLGFDDWGNAPVGGQVKYRVSAVDQQCNISASASSSSILARPAAINNLFVTPSTTASANNLSFTAPTTLVGIGDYKIYAKEQSYALTSLTGATKIAPDVTVAASNTFNNSTTSYAASKAIDGDKLTFWKGVKTTTPQTLTLTFASAVQVKKASLVFSNISTNNRPKDFTVQYYNGSSWQTLTTFTNNTSATRSASYGTPSTAEQVRVSITNTRGGISSYAPIIGEFMIYTGESYVHDLQNSKAHAEPGRTYAYAVIATDLNGHSSDISSGSSTYSTVPDKTPPNTIGSLTLTSPVGTAKVVLKWQKPDDNQGWGIGSGATKYRVYRLPLSASYTPVPVTDSNYNSAWYECERNYPSVPAGTFICYTSVYQQNEGAYYAIRSGDSAGNWSGVSNSPYVAVGKDIQAPAPPDITSFATYYNPPEVQINWNPPPDTDINGYTLYRANASDSHFSSGCIDENNIQYASSAGNAGWYDTSMSDSNVALGNSYYYALRVWDDAFNMSNISNCVYVTMRSATADTTVPTWSGASPLGITQGDYPDIDLLWTAASDLNNQGGAGAIDHYEIFRNVSSFSSTSGMTKMASVTGNRLSYIDSTGLGGKRYYYGVVAVDASTGHNRSVLSNVTTITVKPRPFSDMTSPTKPLNLMASTGLYPRVNLTWTASTDVDDGGITQDLSHYILYKADYPTVISNANKDNPEVTKIIIANDAISYSATGVGGHAYNFVLQAVDLAGNASQLSDPATGQVAPAPCADTTLPTTPAITNATVGPTPDISFTWSASTDLDNCSTSRPIDHYRLYKSASDIDKNPHDGVLDSDIPLSSLSYIVVPGTSTDYTDSSGEQNKTYWYLMTAVDSAGNQSGKSDVVSKTTAADTMPPAAVNDLKASPSSSSVMIQLTWCRPSDNVGVTRYEIYRREQSTILTEADLVATYRIAESTNTGVCLSYDDTNVVSGHTYSYAVKAFDGVGLGSTISSGKVSGDTIATAPTP